MNYKWIDSFLIQNFEEREAVFVDRIIDGDTIEANGQSIRLLGINTPEKGEEYSSESKKFLEEKILNKTVYLEYGKTKYDKYNRILAYVFLGNENINLELVKRGFANYYFPSGKDKYYLEFQNAWIKCVENEINLCEGPEEKIHECIYLEDFDYKNEIITLRNNCVNEIDLTNWSIKDEGRKKFYFPKFILRGGNEMKIIVANLENEGNRLYWKSSTYIWTKTGDTLFLRDNKNKLILWESY